MAIDLTRQKGITLAQAAKMIPSNHGDRPSHISRLVRAIEKGMRYPPDRVVYLEALKFGRQWITTPEAVQEFLMRCTQAALGEPLPEPRTPTRRRREDESAEKQLEAMGV